MCKKHLIVACRSLMFPITRNRVTLTVLKRQKSNITKFIKEKGVGWPDQVGAVVIVIFCEQSSGGLAVGRPLAASQSLL